MAAWWSSCPGTGAPASGVACPIAIGATPLHSRAAASLSRSRWRHVSWRGKCGAGRLHSIELTGWVLFCQRPAAEVLRGHAAGIPTRYVRVRTVGTRHAHDRIHPPGALPPIPRLPAPALLSGFRCLKSTGTSQPNPSEFTSVDLDCLKVETQLRAHTKGLDAALHGR